MALRRTLTVVAVTLVSLLGVSAAALAALRLVHDGEILPGVSVAGIEVGGLSEQAAVAALAGVASAREQDPVVLSDGERTFTVDPADTGFTVDLEATVHAAYGAGRDGGIIRQSLNNVESLWNERHLPLVTRLDDTKLAEVVDGIAAQVDADPTPGAVSASPDTLTVTATPPAPGRQVDRAAARTLVAERLRSPGPDRVALPVAVVAARVDPADVTRVAEQARRALAAPLTLHAQDASVTLQPSQIAPMIGLREESTGRDAWTVRLDVPIDAVEHAFADVAGRFEVAPVSAHFDIGRVPPRSLDDKGTVTWEPVPVDVPIVDSSDGQTFDAELASAQLSQLLATGTHDATLELKTVRPEFTTEDAQAFHLDELLGTFTTYHACCQSRVVNIHRLADMVDGALVAPGEQFSINQISGERTCTKGFQPAGMILAGEIVDVLRWRRLTVRHDHLQRRVLRRTPLRRLQGTQLLHLPLPDGPGGDPELPVTGHRRTVHEHDGQRAAHQDRVHLDLHHRVDLRAQRRRVGHLADRRPVQHQAVPDRVPREPRAAAGRPADRAVREERVHGPRDPPHRPRGRPPRRRGVHDRLRAGAQDRGAQHQPAVADRRRWSVTPDELQIAFHEVECQTYDERFGISHDATSARQAAREAQRLLGDAPLGRVLDVGCGTGYLGLGLAAVGQVGDLHLCDLSPGMLGRAVENAGTLGVEPHVVRATAAALPYPDDTFDAVVTRGVLHHLHDVPAALREWRRVVRPGGPVLVLSEPTRHADSVGGLTARATLGGLGIARTVARVAGRPLSAHDPATAEEHHFWDLVAMAANLHTFTPRDLHRLGREAGFARTRVRGSGLSSIAWASAYYVLAGQLPALADSRRATRNAGRVFAALRRLDAALLERVLPDRALLTVQAVFTG